MVVLKKIKSYINIFTTYKVEKPDLYHSTFEASTCHFEEVQ